MEHRQIAVGHAEKYLLGELSAVERTEFERHLFDCAECAGEVRSAFLFADNARAVFEDERRTQPVERRRRFAWLSPAFAVPALAMLAGIVVYQSAVVIPALRSQARRDDSPQPVASVTLHPMARGEDVIEIAPADRFVHLVLDIDAQQPYPAYDCVVRSEADGRERSVQAPAPAPGAPLGLLLPVSAIQPGPYIVTVRGRPGGPSAAPGPELERYRFAVRKK
jgi:hypothetical protein